MVVQSIKTTEGGKWGGHYMLSFELVACAMFGDIKVVVWVEETV